MPQRPKMGEPGWLPDEDAIRRAEFRAPTPGERMAQAISISRTPTKIAVAAQRSWPVTGTRARLLRLEALRGGTP